MRRMLLVLRYELATTVGRPSFLLGVLSVPLIVGLLLLGLPALARRPTGASLATPSAPQGRALAVEGYVDLAGLIESIPTDMPAGTLRRYASETQARDALRAGEVRAYYVIPADYLANGDLVYVNPDYSIAGDHGQPWVMQHTLFANLLGNDPELIARASQPMDLQERGLALSPRPEDTSLPFYVVYAIALLITVAILSSASLLLSSVAGEKDSRVLEVLMLSVTPQQMLAGKFLALSAAGLGQAVVWLGSGFALLRLSGSTLDLPPGLAPPVSVLAWGILFFLLSYGIYASLMAGLGALVPNLKEASQATILVIWPLVLSVAVAILNSETPHAPLVVALSLFPLCAPVMMMTRLAVGGVPWWQPPLAAGLMLVTAALVIRATAGVFRAQVLLSGQPFTARRFLAALAGRA